jgi:hypothetical protein
VVAHYRPPVPPTGTHFAILFHTSASEEKISFGGEFLSAKEFCESETRTVYAVVFFINESSTTDVRARKLNAVTRITN